MASWEIVSFRLIFSIILLPHIKGVSNIESEPEDDDTATSSAFDIGWPTSRPDVWIPSTTTGNQLEVRLVNGSSNATGRVEVRYNASTEVQYNGIWGTVCDDGWDLNDAHVVCRMLGFLKASRAPVRAAYGAGSGDILLDEVDCTGSESSLKDCIKSKFGEHNCDHSEDAGVICTDPISLDVRLVNGPTNNSGRVEVFQEGTWETICDDGWDGKDANVVCTMLGFFGAAYAPVQATYGEGVGLISLQNVDCIGTESNLGTCFHDRPEPFDCAHDEDAGAACLVLIQDDSESGESSGDGYSGSGASFGDDFSGSGTYSGDGTFELQCGNLNSTTDEDLTTSSTVFITPRVNGSVDNQNFSVGCTYTSHHVFDYGDTWVACAARDDLGNYATCDFTVTVTDGDPPRLKCPDVTSTTDQRRPSSSHITIDPQASDNTDLSPSVICSHTSSDVFQFGDTNVTCNATDESGNIGTCTFVVTVQDTEPPRWECRVQTAIADKREIAINAFIPSVSDNLDPDPSINCSHTYINLSHPGNTSITCEAKDSSGNIADCTFMFNVQDPCKVRKPCINGDCSYEGSGPYQCACHGQYEGDHCDVIPEPTLPVEVANHPKNQTVEMGTTVQLTCGFNNAKYYMWYKDGHPLPNKRNQSTLVIQSVSTSDIGYYFCRGFGHGPYKDTKRASIYIEGVNNIHLSNLKFNLTSNDDLSDRTSLSYLKISLNISNYVLEGLTNDDSFKDLSPSVVCNKLTRQAVVTADLNVYIKNSTLTAFDELELVSKALDGLANNSNGFLDVHSVEIENTAICKNMTWTSSGFGLISFLEGENRTWGYSTEVCPFNRANADQPIGRAICVGDRISQSTWLPDPIDNCGTLRNVSDLLSQLSKVIVSDENVDKLSENVSLATNNTGGIASDDISSIANIMLNISARTNNSVKVTESIVAIVSNIAQVDKETLESASASVSDVVQYFEQQVKSVHVKDGGHFTIQQPNIAVQVKSVYTSDISNGLVLSLTGDSNSDPTNSDTNIHTSNDEATHPNKFAVVNIPSAISSALPLISGGSSNTNGYVRVIFTVFSTPALFISKSMKNTSEGTNRSANTPVISLSIGDETIVNLTEPINFTFTPINTNLTNPSCSYWDFGFGDWSQEGCHLISASGIRPPEDDNCDPPSNVKQEIVCGCNHLTNFAVLMDTSREDGPSEQAYEVLTYIGCCISIVSLLVTLATYISNRVLRGKQTNQIFICLCLTLLCLYVSFIVMMSLDSAKRQCHVKAGPCGFITALVHFFVLSSITWMGVEGYNTYLIIVKIFDTYIPRFMVKAGAVAWGIPAMIVIITGAIAQDKYAHEDLCFLQLWAQIGGLLIPMTIIILFNVVIFVLVVRQLMKSSNVAGRVKREAKVERRESIERVQNAICILLLLGLTWITGYFLMIREFSQVFEPIFIVLNSFQGLFIFLLYCVRKPMVRKQLGLTCLAARVRRQDVTTSSSGTHSSKNTASSAASDVVLVSMSKIPKEKSIEVSIHVKL